MEPNFALGIPSVLGGTVHAFFLIRGGTAFGFVLGLAHSFVCEFVLKIFYKIFYICYKPALNLLLHPQPEVIRRVMGAGLNCVLPAFLLLPVCRRTFTSPGRTPHHAEEKEGCGQQRAQQAEVPAHLYPSLDLF